MTIGADATVVRYTNRRLAIGAIAAATFAISAVIASTGKVPRWEADVFHVVNDQPDFLRPVMWVFQLAGLLLVPALVAVVALLFGRRRLAVALVLLVPVKLVVEKLVVKQLVHRQRPGTSICQLDTACAHFRDVPLSGLSFVSGHAIIAWAVAGLVWPYVSSRWRAALVAIASCNAIARVYLGAHNVLDVVGGAAIGVSIAIALTMIVGTDTGDPLRTS